MTTMMMAVTLPFISRYQG